MRILILTQYFPPEVGASQTRLISVARALVELGHDVQVVTGMPNYPDGKVQPAYRRRIFVREVCSGLLVTRTWLYPGTGYGVRRLANYVSFAGTAAIGLLSSRRPDVLYVESPPLTLAPVGILAARLWRTPVVMFVADPWPDSAVAVGALREGALLNVARSLERWAYQNVDCLTVPTQGLLELLREKGIENQRLAFLPNGIDTTLFSPRSGDEALRREFGLNAEDRVVLYAGTVGQVHGVDVAVSAMRRLRDEHRSVRLLIVGAGSDLPRVREVVRTNADANIHFVKPQSIEGIARIWSIADIGLSTQRALPIADFTRPVKILAAMASGKPVVYSGSGEGADIVRSADAGIVVAPEDPQALSDAIGSLLDDSAEARRLGANGRRYVESKLTWSAVVDCWLDELNAGSDRLGRVLKR